MSARRWRICRLCVSVFVFPWQLSKIWQWDVVKSSGRCELVDSGFRFVKPCLLIQTPARNTRNKYLLSSPVTHHSFLYIISSRCIMSHSVSRPNCRIWFSFLWFQTSSLLLWTLRLCWFSQLSAALTDDPFGHVFLTVIPWPSDLYLFLPGWRCSCNPHQLMINYRCTRQEREDMSETSGGIMNTAREGREEDKPTGWAAKSYITTLSFLFTCLFLCLNVGVEVMCLLHI